MGCVTTKRQKSDVQHAQGKTDQKQLRSNRKNGTYTSIQDNLMRTRQQMNDQIKEDKSTNKKIESNNVISSKQLSIRQKYRMSVQQNRCQMPKISAYQYGPLLIHNPDNIDIDDVQNKENKDEQKLNHNSQIKKSS